MDQIGVIFYDQEQSLPSRVRHEHSDDFMAKHRKQYWFPARLCSYVIFCRSGTVLNNNTIELNVIAVTLRVEKRTINRGI